jgi:hypothetical protein
MGVFAVRPPDAFLGAELYFCCPAEPPAGFGVSAALLA